ncbi:hypothetical protein B484DRAFT_472247, partial [Ochromonadaceae sp. CCMP2298]
LCGRQCGGGDGPPAVERDRLDEAAGTTRSRTTPTVNIPTSYAEAQDQALAEDLNLRLAEAEGGLIECGCCYTDCAFESLVQCTDGHLFCRNCLQHYVEQTVFGNGRSALTCMSADGCEGTFPESMLRLSLPDKVFAKYSEAQARDELKAAHLEGLTACHKCQQQVLMDEGAGSVLRCPYCSAETCRLCQAEAHIPLKCLEAKEGGKKDSKRKIVEEAMTQVRHSNSVIV